VAFSQRLPAAIHTRGPRDWDPSEVAALQAYAGLVASLLSAAVCARSRGRLADQLQAALEHRWLIQQARGVVMGRERMAALAVEDARDRAAPARDRAANQCDQTANDAE
jgi:GAF domain-containing protein